MSTRPSPSTLTRLTAVCLMVTAIASSFTATAQTAVALNDLSFFKSPGKSWSIVSDVRADIGKTEVMTSVPGQGVLLNFVVEKNGLDLYSLSEFGDIDVELDYMMAKGSNSGIYLQGRYEIQLLDSWLVKNPTAGDNGGVYERWDDARPVGFKGYEGYAPRQNVSRAPGLWQHIKISFQAPRFGSDGKKTENAKLLRLDLNGVMIHENIEMQAPTRGGGTEAAEKPLGPLRIQGDHGNVAFKSIRITTFDKAKPSLSDLKYTVYKGRYDAEKELLKLTPDSKGSLESLSANTIDNLPNEFFLNYTGTIKITEAGRYSFSANVPGGRGILKVNGKAAATGQNQIMDLPAGNLPFELIYAKTQDWKNRSLSLLISGPGIRPFMIGDPAPAESGGTDPIYVEAPVNTVLRSFMNLSPGVKSVHAVSVGSPDKVHYTYDLDFGNIVQVWRGGFLDATPMWHDRGNGTSIPVGTVQKFGKPSLLLSKVANPQTAWPADTTGSGYRPRGYKLDKTGAPTFMYELEGVMIEDAISVTGSGQGFKRELTVKGTPVNLYARLAEAGSIEEMGGGLYLVEGKSYYLRIDDATGAKAVVRDNNGRKELMIPVQNKLTYSILF